MKIIDPKKLFIGLSCLLTNFAYASSSTDGIPWPLITAQAFNFSLFLVFLVFMLRKPAANFFKNYRETFIEESNKAQKIVAAAEKQKKDIEEQLKKLETTYASRIETSKKEALVVRQNMIQESNERSARLLADTKENVNVLFKKAEQGIKTQVMDSALIQAKRDLSKKIDAKESQRLHGEFLEEISAGYL